MKHIIKLIMLALFYLLFFNSISCDNAPTESKFGYQPIGIISVIVVDNDLNKTPVPNVEITVTPIDIVQKTDSNGISNFEVEPGNYFVDAEVCCVGPGNIEYHVPVKVIENKTTDVKLLACLLCD
ncbi:MAG: hypothetical protein O6940_05830 [Ignavibacteria bacterium]|nr:hypothetical protein [Ignavibacteria bacterium]